MATTALRKYQRLEATGLWRPDAEAQRIEVIVSVGEATLTITDTRERVQAHWSLAAIARANPGKFPAIYHPDGDPGEVLELAESETEMIAAIEKLRAAIDRQRPRPGRLRLAGILASLLAVVLVVGLWLPGAARDHALRVVPAVKRTEIGRALLAHVQRVTGPACRAQGGAAALAALERRLPPQAGRPHFMVVRSGVRDALRLPGGTILIRADLVEDHDTADVVAGHIIAAHLRAERRDPLARLLTEVGLWEVLRLLATGNLSDEALRAYAETLLKAPPVPLPDAALLEGFARWQVPATPYAYARDITGESVLALIEADPFPRETTPPPVLSDGDWLRLQGICGG
ncbi:hypothetical protein [Roseovarius autotrophicus]|uniref:hypothetical protein n=1 Tax=Roseovarius autotrophicus TaxID=2824121 RepID=UPI001A02DFAF|nr:hypothetical protein [Roseovarius autotrophicus]MBE0455343.1 hypothetical protein [Roseovarius sp.]